MANIRELRTEAGMTLKKLAEETGIGVDLLGYQERGTREFHGSQLVKILKALGDFKTAATIEELIRPAQGDGRSTRATDSAPKEFTASVLYIVDGEPKVEENLPLSVHGSSVGALYMAEVKAREIIQEREAGRSVRFTEVYVKPVR